MKTTRINNTVRVEGTIDEINVALRAKHYQDKQRTFTDKENELVLSISKKVYTKMRSSNKFPIECINEISSWIRDRNFQMLTPTFMDPENIKLITNHIKKF